MPHRHFHFSSPAQRGYIMVLSIIMLLVITLLTVSMAKSFFFEEGMAGNVREKNRSFTAALAALNYAEGVVQQGLSSAVIPTCSAGKQTTLQVCQSAVATTATFSTSPFSSYFPVPTSAISTTYLNASTTPTIGKDTYYAPPGIFIQSLGVAPITGTYVYRITAYGYGTTPNSVSIVQSTYEVVSRTTSGNAQLGF